MSDQSKSQTKHRILEDFTTVVMFVMAIVVATAGALDGHLWALLLIPFAWIITALDPSIGKWRHVWRDSDE